MKFLVLQHVQYEHAGRYARFAKEKGIELETVSLWRPGYRIPRKTQYRNYAAAIILGGPQGVKDPENKYPSKSQELEFIRNFPKPILGHCLGSQLIAYAFGGNVEKGDQKECGFYTIRLTHEGEHSRIFHGFEHEFPVFHWHGDFFEMPPGAVLLAQSLPYRNQAFAAGNKIGVLAHFEMDETMVTGLLQKDSEWFRSGGHGNTAVKIRQDAESYDARMEQCARTLFDNFVFMAAGKRA